MRERPERMIVLGGGPIAVELAQFYQRIGTKVKLIQRSHHILSSGDEDLARPVDQRFRDEGMAARSICFCGALSRARRVI